MNGGIYNSIGCDDGGGGGSVRTPSEFACHSDWVPINCFNANG